MNHDEFRKEIHKYIDAEFDAFCNYQNIVIDIYKTIFEITSRHSIALYVAYGSLLGAVRDSGFLPWDRDIDTFVFFKDVNNLMQILSKELPKEYYMVSNILDPNYHGLMMRVCKKGYNSDAVHVDIFYAVYCSDDEKKQIQQIRLAQFWFEMQRQKHYKNQKNNFKSMKQYYYAKCLALKGKLIPQFVINYEFRKLTSKYDGTNSLLIIAGDATRVIRKNDVVPGKILDIKGTKFHICEKYEIILNKMYGDYTRYLDIANRFKEFYDGITYLNKQAVCHDRIK